MARKRRRTSYSDDDAGSQSETSPRNTSDQGMSPRNKPKGFRNWVFTLNNWTETEVKDLEEYFTSQTNTVKYSFGFEIAPNTGTPHLQGAVVFKSAHTHAALHTRFNKRIHWERMRAKIPIAFAYTHKASIKPPHTFNYKPPMIIKDPMAGLELKNWQKDILQIIDTVPDNPNRTVHWYWEPVGKIGKSAFAKHLIMTKNVYCLAGSAADIKYAMADLLKKKGRLPDILIWDIPKALANRKDISYQAFEELGNGFFFSTKFESGMCVFNPPHIIVFANFPPAFEKMSMDRWRVNNIDERSQEQQLQALAALKPTEEFDRLFDEYDAHDRS